MVTVQAHATLIATLSDEWNPTRSDQLAQLRSLGEKIDGLDVDIQTRDGDQAFSLIDERGMVRWAHSGPMSARSVDELAAALDSLAPVAHRESPVPSRREFVGTTLAAAFLLALKPAAARAGRAHDTLRMTASTPDTSAITLNINGRSVALNIEPRVTLLDALREYAGLTGTKKGCDHGQCGACTVHIDGRRQLSCMTFAMMHQNASITTVEGLASGDALHPMQAAFIKHDGFQCGYCTPGQLMSATALLKEPCGNTDADVKECMSGNICRCGAYPGIVAAIQDVRSTTRG